MYQQIEMSDCMKADVFFEISLAPEYVDEGRLEFLFSFQAGKKGDYLFNAKTSAMADWANTGGRYKTLTVRAADIHAPAEKLRAIERVIRMCFTTPCAPTLCWNRLTEVSRGFRDRAARNSGSSPTVFRWGYGDPVQRRFRPLASMAAFCIPTQD